MLTVTPTAVRSDVPVAASTAVAPLLRTAAPVVVLACFPTAVYARLPSGEVLAVVTSDGLRLPNALVVAAASADLPFARHTGATRGAVTGGALELDGVRYRPVRTWTPRRSTAGVLSAPAVDELAAALPRSPHAGEVARRLRDGTALLAGALCAGDALDGTAAALVGLGPGLTPAGDDVLAGALVTCAHLGDGAPRLAAAVRRRAAATTALSADLLRHAGHGRAAPPVLDLVAALVGDRPVAPALARLLAVGSTSGHDTGTGVLVAARALLDRQEDA